MALGLGGLNMATGTFEHGHWDVAVGLGKLNTAIRMGWFEQSRWDAVV